MQACPAGCITEDGETYTISPGKCIQCLCCMEVCPEGAIDLRDGFLLAAFKKLSGKQ
jgi:formate hydrogenlyase subunit 6/NADH:ubiquinone oxidoreductase subunit I